MKIIEITGIAGVGKSYIITLLSKREKYLLDKDIVNQYKLHDFKLLIYFFKNKKSLYIFNDIIKIAFLLKIPFFNKLNFIRNSIKKFGKNYFITQCLETQEECILIIDEGVSHLYQNVVSHRKQNSEQLCQLVDKIIEYAEIKHQIVIVTAEDTTIYHRLQRRGHKRIKSEQEIENFIEMSKRNINALYKKFYTAIQIENNQQSNLDVELEKIRENYRKID